MVHPFVAGRSRVATGGGWQKQGVLAYREGVPVTPDESSSEQLKPRRRGRPPGIRLTPDKRRMLIQAVEAGGTDHTAARAAGVDVHTYKEWRARVEGRHATRKATPELIELFRDIDEAAARARVVREIEVAERDPKHWLRYKGRSKPGLEGWSEPVPDDNEGAVPIYVPTPEEFETTVRVLAEAIGLVPRSCSDPDCPCTLHKEDPHEGN